METELLFSFKQELFFFMLHNVRFWFLANSLQYFLKIQGDFPTHSLP